MPSGVLHIIALVKPPPHVSHAILPACTRCHGVARLPGAGMVLRMQLSSTTASTVLSEWWTAMRASTCRYAVPQPFIHSFPYQPAPCISQVVFNLASALQPCVDVGEVTSASSYVGPFLLDLSLPCDTALAVPFLPAFDSSGRQVSLCLPPVAPASK